MKKIISILILVFAFSYNAQAQTDKAKQEVSIQANAKQDLAELSKVVDLSNNDSLFRGLYQLFVNKYTDLSKEGISEQDKREISSQVAQKIIASFSDEEMNKIKQTPGLLDKLIN